MSQPSVVGIDLGTTYSVISRVDTTGRPTTILNAEGETLTPSVLYFDGDEVIVGREAVKAARHDPLNSIAFMKREMGRRETSQAVHGKTFPPEVLQSYVLRKLKTDAEMMIGPITSAVITVPAFFDEPRRKATVDAGRIAGLDVLRVINEPTAAAIAYGVHQGFLNRQGEAADKERILVYDLGGGTFDVTLMEIEGKHYRAIATDGDVFLGGLDWDQRIVDLVIDKLAAEIGDSDPRDDPATAAVWLQEAEAVKRSLTAREQAAFTCELAGKKQRITITREEFEEQSADLLERTRFTAMSLLREANWTWRDLTRILLVGGSTRMPMVSRMLHAESGLIPDRSMSPDEAVAHGAAIYADLLSGSAATGTEQVTVTNVNSHSLGVLGIDRESRLPRTQTIIPRHTPLPAHMVKRFQTAEDGQRSVVAEVVEGGDSTGENATRIGRCVVRDLPPNLPAGTIVDVAFLYSEDGRLTVKARLPTLGQTATMVIERVGGMSEKQIAKWGPVVGSGGSPLLLEEM